jgi:hypothetical protein
MKRHNLNSREAFEEQTREHTTQSQPLEFPSVDEMLRHDALHTPVPPGIERRVRDSLGEEAKPQAWWRRWFGL